MSRLLKMSAPCKADVIFLNRINKKGEKQILLKQVELRGKFKGQRINRSRKVKGTSAYS
jgi:hypothetical protein